MMAKVNMEEPIIFQASFLEMRFVHLWLEI